MFCADEINSRFQLKYQNSLSFKQYFARICYQNCKHTNETSSRMLLYKVFHMMHHS